MSKAKAKAPAFVHVRIDADTHKRAKILSAKRGIPLMDVFAVAISFYENRFIVHC